MGVVGAHEEAGMFVVVEVVGNDCEAEAAIEEPGGPAAATGDGAPTGPAVFSRMDVVQVPRVCRAPHPLSQRS